jgi:hypothetical protein
MRGNRAHPVLRGPGAAMRPSYPAVRADAGGEEQLRCDTHGPTLGGVPVRVLRLAGHGSVQPRSTGGLWSRKRVVTREYPSEQGEYDLSRVVHADPEGHRCCERAPKGPGAGRRDGDHPAPSGPNQGASGRTGQTGGFLTLLHPRPEQNRLTAPRRFRRWIQVEGLFRLRRATCFWRLRPAGIGGYSSTVYGGVG